jgi:hypothetical protein
MRRKTARKFSTWSEVVSEWATVATTYLREGSSRVRRRVCLESAGDQGWMEASCCRGSPKRAHSQRRRGLDGVAAGSDHAGLVVQGMTTQAGELGAADSQPEGGF